MPFKSEKQRAWMYANEPEMAERWSKHSDSAKDLPEKVGKMSGRAYAHAYYSTKAGSEERQMLSDARVIGLMVVTEDESMIGKLKGPMKVLDEPLSGKCGDKPCPKCKGKMMGKCDCKVKGKSLPMIGKADDMLEAVPEAVRRLYTQLPLEMQATELGGAGSTDIRPTMRQMNYHVPSQHAGMCATCDHAKLEPGVLVCTALEGSPGVARTGRCDIWSGSAHKSVSAASLVKGMVGKRNDGAGPQSPYYTQTMPDYQYIYNQVPNDQRKKEQKSIDRRRRASAARNNGRYGIHGEAPEPVLRHESTEYPVQIIERGPEKGQTKPTVEAPVITHKRDAPSQGNRLFRMYGKQEGFGEGKGGGLNAVSESSEVLLFPDKEAAERYCYGCDGMMSMPIDLKLAKKYGLPIDGYLVVNKDAGIFEAIR
jgi:hypothetical protein